MAAPWENDPIVNGPWENDPIVEIPATKSEAVAKGGLWNLLGPADLLTSNFASVVAEPVAGLAGVGALVQGKGTDAAVQAIEDTRRRMTAPPETQFGQAVQGAAGEVAQKVIQPAINWWDKQSEEVAQYTGSPAAGAFVKAAPEAIAAAAGARRLSQPTTPTAKTGGGTYRSQVIDDLRQDSDALYRSAEQSGVVVKASKVDAWIDHIEKRLLAKGLDDGLHPQAWQMLQRLKKRKGRDMTLQDLDIERQNMQGVAGTKEAKDAAHGARMIDSFDDFLDNLDDAAVTSTSRSPSAGVEYLTRARDNWRTLQKAKTIDNTIQQAIDGQTTYTAAGFEHSLRVQFKNLVQRGNRDPRIRRQFSDAEWNMMRQVVRGGPIQNVLQWYGKLSGRSPVGGGIGALGGFTLAGPAGAVAVPVTAEIAKQGAARLGTSRVNRLFNEVAGR